jgi:hypothetical protein
VRRIYALGLAVVRLEGCLAKFMESGSPDTLKEGYVTEGNYRWICPKCFRELK